LEIIQNLKFFKNYYHNAFLIGASRKRFLKHILDKNDTHVGDILINSKLIQEKVDIIRVHDIESCSDVIKFMNYFDNDFYLK
jgi:dihydropteroate synthase